MNPRLLIAALRNVVAAKHSQAIQNAQEEILENWDEYKGSGGRSFKDPLKPHPSDIEALEQLLGDVSTIYRCVGFSLEESEEDDDKSFLGKLDINKLGIYWAYEEDKAICYWGRDEDFQVTIEAKITNDAQIDWVNTILQHNIPVYSGEYELRLLPKASVDLVKIDLYDNRNHKRVFLRTLKLPQRTGKA